MQPQDTITLEELVEKEVKRGRYYFRILLKEGYILANVSVEYAFLCVCVFFTKHYIQ